MIRLIVVSIAISFAFTGFGQVPPIVWQSTFGNTGNEVLHSIAAAADGNFMVMGIADVNGDEVDCDLKGQHDVWIFKMTPTGSIIWQKCFGGSKENRQIGRGHGGHGDDHVIRLRPAAHDHGLGHARAVVQAGEGTPRRTPAAPCAAGAGPREPSR